MSSDDGPRGIGRIGLVLPTGAWDRPGDGEAAADRVDRSDRADRSHGFDVLAGLARHAERAGFDGLWVDDRAGGRPSDARGLPREPQHPHGGELDRVNAGPEACSVLGALAMITDRPSLGALVADPFRRHPSTLAKQMTTVDVVAHGRALLGIAPPAPPGRPGRPASSAGPTPVRGEEEEAQARFAEVLRVARSLFTDDAPTWSGRWYRLAGAANRPRPVRAGGCPILVGPVATAADPSGSFPGRRTGDGDRGGSQADGLEPAARWADGVIFAGGADAVAPAVDRLARHCRRVGRDVSELTLLWTGEVEVASSLDVELRRMVDAGIQAFAVRITARTARSAATGSARAAACPDLGDVTAVAGVLRAVVGGLGATGRPAGGY